MLCYVLQLTGKEVCSLSKEEFLKRSPDFMGDILWAHLEILQKDVDRGANIENVPSNYSDSRICSDSSFAIPDTFQRTYTQLDVAPSAQTMTSVEGSSIAVSTSNRPHFTTQRASTGCYPTSVADYVSNNGSTVDSSSEFSYQMEMKYSPSQQILNNGRVPAYPPAHLYNDQFENMWSYQNPTTLHQQEAWHQPHDFAPAVTPPATTMAPPTSQAQTAMHHHPAFLQVGGTFFIIVNHVLYRNWE